jgi:hypothetical protein
MEAVHTYPQQWQEGEGCRLYSVRTYPQQWQEDGGWRLYKYIPIHSNGKKVKDGCCTAEDIAAGPHITKSGAQAPFLAYLEKRKVLVSTFFGNSIPYSLHNVRDNLILFPVQVLLEKKRTYTVSPLLIHIYVHCKVHYLFISRI